MKANICWIEGPWNGKLGILPRPRGGDWLEDEVRAWGDRQIAAVVSLLTSAEIAELDLSKEAEFCLANGIEFLSLPISDRGVPPSRKPFLDLVKNVEKRLIAGNNVAVHCRQGIGRSALLAAALLSATGVDPATAFSRISAARGCAVPDTSEQREWVMEFGRLLGSVAGTPS